MLRLGNMLVRKIQYRHDDKDQADNHRYKAVLVAHVFTHLHPLCHPYAAFG